MEQGRGLLQGSSERAKCGSEEGSDRGNLEVKLSNLVTRKTSAVVEPLLIFDEGVWLQSSVRRGLNLQLFQKEKSKGFKFDIREFHNTLYFPTEKQDYREKT